jgi:hypothetical protein
MCENVLLFGADVARRYADQGKPLLFLREPLGGSGVVYEWRD